MGGRGSGGGRRVKAQTSSVNTQTNGEKIYKQKALKKIYINRKEFNEMREYLKDNVSKADILKLAERYGEVYENRIDKNGFSAAEFRSYELSLKELAKRKKGD